MLGRINPRASRSLHAVVIGAVLASACVAEVAEQNALDETFEVAAHEVDTFEAHLSMGPDSLVLQATETSNEQLDVVFDFGQSRIEMAIDYARGVGNFSPSGEPLDVADGLLIDRMLARLTETFPDDESARTFLEAMLLRQASFMQIVPEGEPLEPFEFQSQHGWVHLSCTCSTQFIGSGYYRTAGKGCGCRGGSGNGCKGRCGQGCGITSAPPCTGTTVYTRDCAKHDYGLGSFWAASDDYSFAPNNCSCGGVGSCY